MILISKILIIIYYKCKASEVNEINILIAYAIEFAEFSPILFSLKKYLNKNI